MDLKTAINVVWTFAIIGFLTVLGVVSFLAYRGLVWLF